LLDDERANKLAFQELKEKGQIRYENLPLRTKTGIRREVEFVGRVYHENDRQVVQCNIRDVSERRKEQAAKFLLAAIVESSQDSIISIDFHRTITSWNRGAEVLYGYSASEAIGKPLTTLTLPEDFQEVLARIDKVREGNKIEEFETERVHKDGRSLVLTITLSPIKDALGRTIGVSTIARDVTQRKRAMDAMRYLGEASMSLFTSLDQGRILHALTRLLVPHLADWAFIDLIRGEGVERIAVAHANPGHADLAEQMKLHAPDREAIEHPAARSLFSGKAVLIAEFSEEMLVKASNSPAHEAALRKVNPRSLIVVPLISRHKILGALTLATSESGRRFDQQDLAFVEELARRAGTAIDNSLLYSDAEEAAKRLAYADRSKDEFLAMLAHELRNPLAPIKSAAEVLRLRKYDDPVITRVQTILERQADHMIRLVDDLLDTSRIQHRKVKLNKVPLDLNSTILSVIDAVDDSVKQNEHTLTMDIKNDPPLYVDADPSRMSQIISNLLVNAIKYTPKRGAIHVSTAPERGNVILRVRDNGIGIEPHMLQAIFDLFTQEEVSLERSRGGLGLGLKLVKELVELQGGTVEARSEGKGKGSEFIVCFPESLRSKAASPAVKDMVPGPRRRILLMDDNIDILDSMNLMLTMSGHTVEMAEDGQKGVEKALLEKFDVALVDIGMPKMNGYEVAKQLRSNPATSRMVLIALTGYGQNKDKHRARDVGFNEHLTKPVDASTLTKLLNELENYRA